MDIEWFKVCPTILEATLDTIKLNCDTCDRKDICNKLEDKADKCKDLMDKLDKGEYEKYE